MVECFEVLFLRLRPTFSVRGGVKFFSSRKEVTLRFRYFVSNCGNVESYIDCIARICEFICGPLKFGHWTMWCSPVRQVDRSNVMTAIPGRLG
jgi:hypothetical protein